MYHLRVTTFPLAEYAGEVSVLITGWVKSRQALGYAMAFEKQNFAVEWPTFVSTFQFNSLSDYEAYVSSLKADTTYLDLWKKLGPLMRGPTKQEIFYVEIPYSI